MRTPILVVIIMMVMFGALACSGSTVDDAGRGVKEAVEEGARHSEFADEAARSADEAARAAETMARAGELRRAHVTTFDESVTAAIHQQGLSPAEGAQAQALADVALCDALSFVVENGILPEPEDMTLFLIDAMESRIPIASFQFEATVGDITDSYQELKDGIEQRGGIDPQVASTLILQLGCAFKDLLL